MSGGMEDSAKEEACYAPLRNHADIYDRLSFDYSKWTEPHPLQKVFDEVINQVSKGKGEERHGNGKEFMQQPWYSLAETHGIGFLTGQAGKKLGEAQGMIDDRWRREMIGAVVYAMMALLYDDIKKGK